MSFGDIIHTLLKITIGILHLASYA